MKLSDALKLFDESETDQSTRKECLITRQEIKNEIILKCNHSFEYDALLKHMIGSQRHFDYHKCPYCRKVNSGFIPFCQNPDSTKSGEELLNTVNRNVFKKNEYMTCSYCFASGKNKGKLCGKVGHKFNDGTYCFAHYKQVTKHKIKMSAPKESKPQCCHILKNGNQCKLKCFNNETGLCKRHDKLEK
jgi:hypothetical protein